MVQQTALLVLVLAASFHSSYSAQEGIFNSFTHRGGGVTIYAYPFENKFAKFSLTPFMVLLCFSSKNEIERVKVPL